LLVHAIEVSKDKASNNPKKKHGIPPF
jgi:hypothetical protein